jgi:hypothetical protein
VPGFFIYGHGIDALRPGQGMFVPCFVLMTYFGKFLCKGIPRSAIRTPAQPFRGLITAILAYEYSLGLSQFNTLRSVDRPAFIKAVDIRSNP